MIQKVPSVGSLTCRICQTTTREQLISPCCCKGSLRYVHLSCLEHWLNVSMRDTCELCLFRFNAVQTRRYSCWQSLVVWLRHPRNRSHLISDLCMSLVLTLLTSGLCGICLMGIKYFIVEGLRVGFTDVWTKGVITIFVTIVIFGYFTTMYLMAKDHILPWYRWWTTCVNVRLLVDLDVPTTYVQASNLSLAAPSVPAQYVPVSASGQSVEMCRTADVEQPSRPTLVVNTGPIPCAVNIQNEITAAQSSASIATDI